MGTRINEPITVGAVFQQSLVRPAWFRWGGRLYTVRDVTQRWQTKDGQALLWHLGVTDGATCFELIFNAATLRWSLAAVELPA